VAAADAMVIVQRPRKTSTNLGRYFVERTSCSGKWRETHTPDTKKDVRNKCQPGQG
jgi:hypothetical protein